MASTRGIDDTGSKEHEILSDLESSLRESLLLIESQGSLLRLALSRLMAPEDFALLSSGRGIHLRLRMMIADELNKESSPDSSGKNS